MYLKSEISKMANAYEVFEALAKGYVRFSDILSQSFELNLHKDAEKSCILNRRILWFFSNAYKLLEDKELVDYAKHAYKFLWTRHRNFLACGQNT